MQANKIDFVLVTIIVNDGKGTKILHQAKKSGACGGTIVLGRGTIKSGLLKFLELYDEQKEIVLILAEKNVAYCLLKALDEEYDFKKPHHGIAFCTPAGRAYGSKKCQECISNETGSEDTAMYQAIYVIVDKGKGEAVVEAATKAGSTGGTIMNARGAGAHETSKLFAMEIEPEKEVVLIISQAGKTDAIASSILDAMEIDKPGNGIMYIQDVSNIYGLHRKS